MSETTAQCGEHYEQHPTRPELVAVCTLPKDHGGAHNNLLSKANPNLDEEPTR